MSLSFAEVQGAMRRKTPTVPGQLDLFAQSDEMAPPAKAESNRATREEPAPTIPEEPHNGTTDLERTPRP